MWEIYGSHGFGVAVKSSFEHYRKAARFEVDSSYYAFGKVSYHADLEEASEIRADFRASVSTPGSERERHKALMLGFHKRSCYHYEDEWRAVIWQEYRREISGVTESFDLDRLIDEVWVGHRDEGFMFEVVKSIMERFSLRKPLRPSALLRSPERQPALPG